MNSSKRHDRPDAPVRQAWIESMLKALNPEKHEGRIQRAINQLESVKHGSDKRSIDYCGHCLLYTSPSPRDVEESRMPSSA